MPQIPRLPKRFPYRHLVSLFTIGVLVATVSVLDALLMADFTWIDLFWTIPIITAAFLLSPLEVVGVGMISVVLCLASQVESKETINAWISAAIGAFSLIVAVKAVIIRKYYGRVNVIQDALEESPLAYAEFSFPGYKLLNSNASFSEMIGSAVKAGVSLRDFLPEATALELSEKMDQAITTRQRVDCDEFQMPPSAEGRNSFW